MRELWPDTGALVEARTAYATDPSQYLMRLSMVFSVDGSATDEDDWTDHLGGEADRRMLRALRSISDAIVVGAGTVRTGRLGPVQTPRYLDGDQAVGPPARLVVVTNSLEIDWSSRIFSASHEIPIVVAPRASLDQATSMPKEIREHAVCSGDQRVDLKNMLDQLVRQGYRRILCEGGPSLGSALVDAGVVDELCIAVAPVVMPADRLRGLALAGIRVPVQLLAVYQDDDVLFLRYMIARLADGS